MTRHFTLVVAGYGVEAKPKLPVAVGSLVDGSLIFGPFERQTANVKNVLVKPGLPPTGTFARHPIGNIVTYSTGQRGSTQVVLGVDMPTYDPVLDDFRAADHPAHWSIITDDHSIRWPAMATLHAHGVLEPRGAPYQLSLGEHKLIIPVGPFTKSTLPKPEHLIAPQQRFARQGGFDGAIDSVTFVELAYEHATMEWLQRYYFVPLGKIVYLLQAQAPRATATAVFVAADLVATSMRPR
ncbi:MAG: hypothetical protein JWO36_2992 [Myxococcales bacterium]|nr:hypothetical protein [Myxococcales bacterium]